MKRQRSAVALGLMVVALLAWLVVRSRLPSPTPNPPKTDVPTASPVPNPGVAVSPHASPVNTPTIQSPSPVPTPTPKPPDRAPPDSTVGPSASPAASVSITANPPPASSESATINAIKVRRMITDFHTLTGENPVGTNAEIMAAVMGKNPRQAIVGPPEGLGLNTKGELVDDWGTPYFFHQLSRDVMEIHSAGPDRILGTADDVIVR